MAIRPTNKIGNWTPGKTLSEMSQDPLRAVRAYVTQGLSEAPRATGKPGWDQMLKMGPPGGATPLIPQIANPYEQVAGQAATGLGGMLPKYGELYGTGSGAVSGLIGDLQKQARGEAGPGMSLGQALLQQGLTQNIGAVQSQLASQRGLSPAIRARLAAEQTAALQGQSAQQAGLMGLQQQLAAQQQLGQLGMGAAQLGSESQIRGTGTLTGAATDIAKTQANIAAANQAAQAADKARTVQAATGIVQGGAQVLAKRSLPEGSASLTGEQTAGPDTYGQGGANQYRTYAAHGGRIDGTAPYAGDTPKNDVVKANLSPGEIVIPRSAAGSKKAAKAFIEALDDWDEEPSYGKVLKARQKKNFADGGKVPTDDELVEMYRPSIESQLTKPIPAVQKMKQSFDQFLTERVVEPLAQRGYPTLGAALATMPSTAMEYFVPGTPQEAMAGVIPFPKGMKKAAKLEKKSEELAYRITHKAPTKSGAPLHDLTINEVYPKDVYQRPDYYYSSDDEKIAADIISKFKNKPDSEITIYRAVPKNVSEINPGDWVALTKEYAEKHLEKDGKIIATKVKAKDLFNDGNSFAEFGYNGKKKIKIEE